jgi:hypothetical protein
MTFLRRPDEALQCGKGDAGELNSSGIVLSLSQEAEFCLPCAAGDKAFPKKIPTSQCLIK